MKACKHCGHLVTWFGDFGTLSEEKCTNDDCITNRVQISVYWKENVAYYKKIRVNNETRRIHKKQLQK